MDSGATGLMCCSLATSTITGIIEKAVWPVPAKIVRTYVTMRKQIVDVLGVSTQNTFGDLHEVVKTTSELHGGNRGDHGRDDQDHVPGNVTRLHAEAQGPKTRTPAPPA